MMNIFRYFDTLTWLRTPSLWSTGGQCFKVAKDILFPRIGQCVKVAKGIQHFIQITNYFSDLSKCQSSAKGNSIFPYRYATLTLWHVRKITDSVDKMMNIFRYFDTLTWSRTLLLLSTGGQSVKVEKVIN